MADSKYGLNEKDRDIQRFLEKTSGDSKFKDMLKLIMEGNSTKKVDNFLDGDQMMAMHDYQKDPELRKNLLEIINTPGYDPDSVREAQRQIIRMNQGLPRFPGV
jgi:hypothetical protein